MQEQTDFAWLFTRRKPHGRQQHGPSHRGRAEIRSVAGEFAAENAAPELRCAEGASMERAGEEQGRVDVLFPHLNVLRAMRVDRYILRKNATKWFLNLHNTANLKC